MPASYCHLALHIVFSTRNRVAWLKDPYEEQLHKYMVGIIHNLKGVCFRIGGFEDHIHILCLIPKDISLVEFMTKLKSSSSKWFREFTKMDFHWQDGYGAFSVSKSMIPVVKDYIMNQRVHHTKHSFEDEFDNLLKSHQLDKSI